MAFHFMYVHIIFSSVWVAQWPPFGKSCSLGCPLVHFVFRLLEILVISSFDFESWVWVLTASVPDNCLLVTFSNTVIAMCICKL